MNTVTKMEAASNYNRSRNSNSARRGTKQDRKYMSQQINKTAAEDGVTHINIDANAKTLLGRLLVNMERTPFNHPAFGRFDSIEGFWNWVTYKNKMSEDPETKLLRGDKWRTVYGMNAKKLGQKIAHDEKYRVEDFYAIILEAIYFKIDQTPELREEFLKSTLPFRHYYVNYGDGSVPGGLVVTPTIASWLVPGIERIRTLMKEGYEPERPDYSDVVTT